jgi:hypothetical protein
MWKNACLPSKELRFAQGNSPQLLIDLVIHCL